MTECAPHMRPIDHCPASSHPVLRCEEKRGWRELPSSLDAAVAPRRVVATRWSSLREQALNAHARTADDFHLMCIALRRMDVRLSVSGRLVHDGTVTPGTVQLTGPGVSAECLFRGAYDALHLHISNDLIDECASEAPGTHNDLLLTKIEPFHDPLIERLGLALLEGEQLDSDFARIYTDSLSIAIVSRLLAFRLGASDTDRSSSAGLIKWRLKRAVDYIEENLSEPIGLAEIAASTGLTRMHFAAQFRVATGLRPHEYLLRRRVERAQQILLAPNAQVLDVALEVGFQTQAHFTTVFKRFVGQPPHAWRQTQTGWHGATGRITESPAA